MDLAQLLEQYGYLAILVGSFLEGETILMLGGIAAEDGYLHLHWVILIAFIGTLCGDQLYFLLGRRYGRTWLLRRPRWQAKARRLDILMQRWGVMLILLFRFMYGVRTAAVLVFGMSDIGLLRFALFNALGALLWAGVIGTLGYWFGHGLDWLLEADTHQRLMSIAAIGLIALAIWGYCLTHLPVPPMQGRVVAVAARVAGRRRTLERERL